MASTSTPSTTAAAEAAPPSPALSPLERSCEIVFGLLMTASFVAAYELSSHGQASVRELFVTALGCNIAWGLIDAAIFLLQCQFGRFRNHSSLRELHDIADEQAFRARVRDELPPLMGSVLTDDSFAAIRRLAQTYAKRRPAFWSGQELLGALWIWVMVACATFPLVLPFLLMSDAWLAIRTSHAITVVMLFALGWWIGRWSGVSSLKSGLVLAGVGTALSVACSALGG